MSQVLDSVSNTLPNAPPVTIEEYVSMVEKCQKTAITHRVPIYEKYAYTENQFASEAQEILKR